MIIFVCMSNGMPSIILEGTYQGKNLYVQNPFSASGVGFCVTLIRVNGEVTTDETQSSAFEIDLRACRLRIGDPVRVVIEHKEECKPKVLNPEVLKPRSTFTVTQIAVVPQDNAHVLQWKTSGENGRLPFRIEQYRWNKWVRLAETEGKGTTGTNDYAVPVLLHSGENQLRVAQTDFTGQLRTSPVAKFRAEIPAITFRLTGGVITFSSQTLYEIYDRFGNIVQHGSAKEVNVSELRKGPYFLNYDNTMGEFEKKS